MTIPTIEPRHRRLIKQDCSQRPKPPTRYAAPLDNTDISTQRISRPSRSPPIRSTAHCGQRALETQTPTLFTRASNFPTRTLPLPGIRASNLDLHIAINHFQIDQVVKVRRFLRPQETWTEWQVGKVVAPSRVHGLVGSNARGYVVSTISPTTRESVEETYAPYLAEIYCVHDPEPSISPKECSKRKDRGNQIYTRLPCSGTLFNIPYSRIWVPARVLAWEEGRPIRVICLAGRPIGKQFDVTNILPYTHETSNACRLQGYHVMDSDGLLLSPIAASLLV